jgi:hypothetical protein
MNVQEILKRNRRCIATTLRGLQMPNTLKDIVLNFVGRFHTFDDLVEIFGIVAAVLNCHVRPFKFESFRYYNEFKPAELPPYHLEHYENNAELPPFDPDKICCVTDRIFYSPDDYIIQQSVHLNGEEIRNDTNPDIYFREVDTHAGLTVIHKKQPVVEICPISRDGTITYRNLLDVVAQIETYMRLSTKTGEIDTHHIFLEGFSEGPQERGGMTFKEEEFGAKVWLINLGS